jgi:hypothetical protein
MSLAAISERILATDRPEEWSTAVLNHQGNVAQDLRGERSQPAASLGKLMIAAAAIAVQDNIPFDTEVTITETDHRIGGGALQYFPPTIQPR